MVLNFIFFLFIDNQGKCSAELSRKRDEITNFPPEDIWISFSCYQYRSYHQGRRKWRSAVSLLPNVNQGFTFLRSFDTLRTQWNRLCPEKGRGSEKSIYLKKEINSWIWYLFIDLRVFSNFKSSNHHLEIGGGALNSVWFTLHEIFSCKLGCLTHQGWGRPVLREF